MIQKNSKMVEKLRNDELVTCVKLNVANMVIAEIAAYAGFDCIWIDMEHVPADYQEIRAEEGAERAICDYIAGMTDPYAVEQFKKIYIPMGWKVK